MSAAHGDGIRLGGPASPWYPFAGVRDARIEDNVLRVPGVSIELAGAAPLSQRFQVTGNTGSASYVRPAFVAGDHWARNADRVTYGTPTSTRWSAPTFTWERYDRGVRATATTSGGRAGGSHRRGCARGRRAAARRPARCRAARGAVRRRLPRHAAGALPSPRRRPGSPRVAISGW